MSRQIRDHNLLRSLEIDYETARSLASVFKDITDFRSRFTATHSTGVAVCARELGKILAFTGKDLQKIELAGLMHDIGKLVVPNAIICKPSPLTAREFSVIRQHPHYTHRILSRVRGFEQIAEWAAFHHERLNGTGYCTQLDRSDLDIGAKVIAIADVSTAIAERRPYREPGQKQTVLSELFEMSGKGLLERQIVEALADNYQTIMGSAEEAQKADDTRYNERYAMIG
jgi:HD-GYP domain-containing protein (c-di-GMP phosphodiesterase class II)